MTLLKHQLLDGVRVLDFSWLAAGPTGTFYLAALGAEVLRIESRGALDNYRRLFRQGNDPNQSELFASVNYGKRSVTVDLKHPRAGEVIGALVANCDLVVENFSPGTLDRLNLGYDFLRTHRRDVVMVSCSSTGHVGPMVRNAGYAPIFAALGGLCSVAESPDGGPPLFGRQFDARVGAFVALAAAAGLLLRSRTGQGGHYDLSGQEVAASCAAEATTSVTAGQELYGVDRARVRYLLGSDGRWVVAEQVNGRGDLADLEENATELTSGQLAELGRERGIRMTVASTAADILSDEEFSATGLFAQADQPGIGRQLAVGPPIRWSSEIESTPLGLSPDVGADTMEVLRRVAEMSEGTVQSLEEAGTLE